MLRRVKERALWGEGEVEESVVDAVEEAPSDIAVSPGRTYTTCAMTASATITMQNSSVFTIAKKSVITG